MVPVVALRGAAFGRPILVVEDDPGVRALVCAVLAEAGYPVLQAPNGRSALDIAARARPQAVITDVRMPEMDGPTFVRCYRAAVRHTPPVIALSASPGGLEEAAEAGVDAALPKPFDVGELLAVVERLLRSHPPVPGEAVAALIDPHVPLEAAALRAHARELLTRCQTHNGRAALQRSRIASVLATLEARTMARRERLLALRRSSWHAVRPSSS